MNAGVHAVTLDQLDQVSDPVIAAWLAGMSVATRERASGLRARRRYRQFVAGRQLLKTLLWRQYGLRCEIDSGPDGRPQVTGHPIHCSISHSGFAVMAACSEQSPTGVDIESNRPREIAGLVNSYFSSSEQSHFASLDEAARLPWFYHCWTRKEACAKLSGEGLCLRTLACSEAPRGVAVTTVPMAKYTASIAHDEAAPVTVYRAQLDPAAGLRLHSSIHLQPAVRTPPGLQALAAVQACTSEGACTTRFRPPSLAS